MKSLTRVSARTAWALIVSAACFAQNSWTEKSLFNFQGTSSGGASNCGSAHRLTPASNGGADQNMILFNFTCGASDSSPSWRGYIR